jgi:hypothetical protein|eukprot:scaffold5112_cov76-Skeletonema_menzelii.AAC.2
MSFFSEVAEVRGCLVIGGPVSTFRAPMNNGMLFFSGGRDLLVRVLSPSESRYVEKSTPSYL